MAALIWSVIHYKVMTPFGKPVTHFLRHLPITVLSEANSTDSFQVVPSTVNVVVRGPAGIVERLSESDIGVYVNVTSREYYDDSSRPIEVVAPKGVEIIQISPTHVQVRRIPNPVRESIPLQKP